MSTASTARSVHDHPGVRRPPQSPLPSPPVRQQRLPTKPSVGPDQPDPRGPLRPHQGEHEVRQGKASIFAGADDIPWLVAETPSEAVQATREAEDATTAITAISPPRNGEEDEDEE